MGKVPGSDEHDVALDLRGSAEGVGTVLPRPPFDFLTSKVRAPGVRPGSVPRVGLVNRLRATRSSAIVTLAGPAG